MKETHNITAFPPYLFPSDLVTFGVFLCSFGYYGAISAHFSSRTFLCNSPISVIPS